MNELNKTFNFDGAALRTVSIDGEPWFMAADVCAALSIANSRDAVTRLDEDERGVATIDTLGGAQEMATVNESGLYSLIVGSRKPEAKRFKKWVTSEVLPQIRKTGSYNGVGFKYPENMHEALRLAADMSEQKALVEAKLAIAAPVVIAFNRLTKQTDGAMCITDGAKSLQMQPGKLFGWLRENCWIYRRAGGTGWVAYQVRLQAGVLEHRIVTVERADGSSKMHEQVLITAKGLALLAQRVGRDGSELALAA